MSQSTVFAACFLRKKHVLLRCLLPFFSRRKRTPRDLVTRSPYRQTEKLKHRDRQATKTDDKRTAPGTQPAGAPSLAAAAAASGREGGQEASLRTVLSVLIPFLLSVLLPFLLSFVVGLQHPDGAVARVLLQEQVRAIAGHDALPVVLETNDEVVMVLDTLHDELRQELLFFVRLVEHVLLSTPFASLKINNFHSLSSIFTYLVFCCPGSRV